MEPAFKEKEWIKLRDQIMNYYGYCDEDMDDDSIEDKVNRLTDNLFFETFSEEYI